MPESKFYEKVLMSEVIANQVRGLLDSGIKMLRFPTPLEQEYINGYLASEHIVSIKRYTFGFIIFLLFSFLDYSLLPLHQAVIAWIVRVSAVILAGLITVAGLRYRHTKTGFVIGGSVVLTIFTAQVAIDCIGRVSAGNRMPLGSLFVIVYFCTIMSLPFLYSTSIVMIMLIIQVLGMFVLSGLYTWEILNTLLFYTFIPVMLLASVYWKDSARRKIFLLNMLRQKYEKSRLDESEAGRITDMLGTYMDSARPWLQSELSIADVAREIGVSRHQLTQAINERLKMNFNAYVNGYRIRHVVSEMGKTGGGRCNWTFLELAMNAGFNSKSSFNRVFRDVTGMTPSQYRKKCR
ncbi:MAG TPA: AraC family transcriptional regulator [Spirochaetota bacterium]|nr:AraC family transcriptional regulator [Spirochaetota bacterium]